VLALIASGHFICVQINDLSILHLFFLSIHLSQEV
jgi:hypothetical protein